MVVVASSHVQNRRLFLSCVNINVLLCYIRIGFINMNFDTHSIIDLNNNSYFNFNVFRHLYSLPHCIMLKSHKELRFVEGIGGKCDASAICV